MLIAKTFDGSSIYEWNPDDKAEHEIITTIFGMPIAFDAIYRKINNKFVIFDLKTAGFTRIF